MSTLALNSFLILEKTAERIGIDLEKHCPQSLYHFKTLHQSPRNRVPTQYEEIFWQEISQLKAANLIPFKMANAAHHGDYVEVELFAQVTPRLDDLLKRFSLFSSVVNSSWKVEVVKSNLNTSLMFKNTKDRKYHEMGMSFCILYFIRRLLANYECQESIEEIHFKQAWPVSCDHEFKNLFGNLKIVFSSDSDQIVFNKSIVDITKDKCNLNLLDLIHNNFVSELKILSQRPSQQMIIKKFLKEEDILSGISLEKMAKKLSCSPRTLQRNLKREHITFADVLLEEKMQRSREKLKLEHYKIKEIAYIAGFADISSFIRSFKKYHNNVSPSEWRKQFLQQYFSNDLQL